MTTIYLHLSPYSLKVPADLIGMSQEQLSALLIHSVDDNVRGDYQGVPYICVATAERSEIRLFPQADMVTATVATMRARQQTLRAQAEVECTRIDTAIGKLLAIEVSA